MFGYWAGLRQVGQFQPGDIGPFGLGAHSAHPWVLLEGLTPPFWAPTGEANLSSRRWVEDGGFEPPTKRAVGHDPFDNLSGDRAPEREPALAGASEMDPRPHPRGRWALRAWGGCPPLLDCC